MVMDKTNLQLLGRSDPSEESPHSNGRKTVAAAPAGQGK